jgi:chromosome segregation ATPase
LGTSGCGDDSVEVGDYANDVCTALRGWAQDVRDSQTELQEKSTQGASLETDRDSLQQFVDDAVAATDDLKQEVEDAGEPDIDGGGEVADAFHEAVEDTRSRLETARDDVGEIPADNPEEYRAAVDDFIASLRSTLEGIDEHFEDVDAPDLDTALDEASACQG